MVQRRYSNKPAAGSWVVVRIHRTGRLQRDQDKIRILEETLIMSFLIPLAGNSVRSPDQRLYKSLPSTLHVTSRVLRLRCSTPTGDVARLPTKQTRADQFGQTIQGWTFQNTKQTESNFKKSSVWEELAWGWHVVYRPTQVAPSPSSRNQNSSELKHSIPAMSKHTEANTESGTWYSVRYQPHTTKEADRFD